MEIHDKIKPTHHFETKEISEFADVGAKLKLSIAIPPPGKRRRLDEHMIINMVRKCIKRIENEFHDFTVGDYKLK